MDTSTSTRSHYGPEAHDVRPLSGVRVLVMVGIGPISHATLVLAGMGAEITRVDRPEVDRWRTDIDPLNAVLAERLGSVAVDLRTQPGRGDVLARIADADVLLEGMRPGVMERLGLGPESCRQQNPALVYGRVTGWGQSGPLAGVAGHDINYLSVAGTLHDLRRRGERPMPPFNYVADYGAGSMFLVSGVLAALTHARSTGKGLVVDAGMVDGLGSLMSFQFALRSRGDWDRPGGNTVASPPPWYDVYETADGGWVACGAAEPQFYAELLRGLGLEPKAMPQDDATRWPEYAAAIASVFQRRTRDDWAAVFEGRDACVTPVLSPHEAAEHPHVAYRRSVVDEDGDLLAGAAPRFAPLA